MAAITGIWKDGQIVLDTPASWPDGCRVVIEPLREALGVREEDWQNTPEAIADWLRWYDSLEPLVRTPQEETEWAAVRQAQKELEKTRFDERARRAGGLFP